MKKAFIIVLPFIFTAQACNLLLGGGGDEGSGPRGIFLSIDSGQSWKEAQALGRDKSLASFAIARMFIEDSTPRNLLAAALGSGVAASDSHGESWAVLLPDFTAYDTFINPGNSEEIFAAGSRNRLAVILKSPDRGQTWLMIYNEPTGQAAVTSLIQDPANPAVLYAGLSSGTVLKSPDAGLSWNVLLDIDDRIVKLVAAPDGKTVYLVSRRSGLRRSRDAGRTWQSLNIAEAATPYHELILDRQNFSVLYVGTGAGLFKSADGGNKWTKLLLPATPEINEVTAAAVNPGRGSQIFAAIRSTVYRSDDSGSSWRPVKLPSARRVSSIVIDPLEPNRIYAGLR